MSEAARILAEGRISGDKISAYPSPAPGTKKEAFALQSAVRQHLGWKHRGWKVGCTSRLAQESLATDAPFPGPVYGERLFASGSEVPTKPSNWRVTEPEIAFTLKGDLPARGKPYDAVEVMMAVESVHPAVEIVNPRLPKGFSDKVEWYIADGGLNDALVLGPAHKPLSVADYAKVRAEAKLNGRVVGRGTGANALGGSEIVLTWLANHLIEKGLNLKAGDIVTTGVITEVFRSGLGDEIIASFEGVGTVRARFSDWL
jgi:2-keto-4-pentenoate hydratase